MGCVHRLHTLRGDRDHLPAVEPHRDLAARLDPQDHPGVVERAVREAANAHPGAGLAVSDLHGGSLRLPHLAAWLG